LARFILNQPTIVLSVPRGQIHPQKNLPRNMVSTTTMRDSRNIFWMVCAARRELRAIKGSKSRKSLTGMPSSLLPLYSVCMKRTMKNARNTICDIRRKFFIQSIPG
jgi:hypothetical protein